MTSYVYGYKARTRSLKKNVFFLCVQVNYKPIPIIANDDNTF